MYPNDQIDVLLFGLGAIGSFYGFILSRAPRVRLTVVARSNYEAVSANGITIDSENHGKHTFRPFKVVKSPSDATGPFDFIVCAHKAIDQDGAIALLEPVVDSAGTTIVIIQNGVGNEEPFRRKFPDATIISCVAWTGATQTSPGVTKHAKTESLQLGLFPNPTRDVSIETSRIETFASLLSAGGTNFSVLPDIQLQRWEKVVWNAAWNSLTALTGLDTQSWLSSSPDAVPMTRRLMKEVIDVGRACGVSGLEYALVDRLMDRIMALPGIGSSMMTDCQNRRPLEVDAILGYPVKRARELGVDVPVLETLYTTLRAVDLRLRREREREGSV